MQASKWICTIAGSGIALGVVGYFQNEKRKASASWTTGFVPSTKWDSNWDKRDPSSLVRPKKHNRSEESEDNRINEEKEKVKATATRNLLFVRHGQYNLEGLTDSERRLTPLGREQADATGLRLKNLNFKFTKIVESTMSRAKETSSIIRKHLPDDITVESCDMLREGLPSPVEPAVGSWKPEVQQYYEDGARIEAAFRKYFHRATASQVSNSYELYICHANVIRYFICRVLQFPPEAWLRFGLHNCSITWISIRPNGRVYVYSIGDCGHIPPNKLTTS